MRLEDKNIFCEGYFFVGDVAVVCGFALPCLKLHELAFLWVLCENSLATSITRKHLLSRFWLPATAVELPSGATDVTPSSGAPLDFAGL